MTKTIIFIVLATLLIGVILVSTRTINTDKNLSRTKAGQAAAPVYLNWREFIDQSRKFKILLPSTPQYIKETLEIPKSDKKRRYEIYVSEGLNGSVFMINLITYPSDVDTSNIDQILHDTVYEIISTHPSNQLKELTETIYQNQQAVDFHVINQNFDVQGKAFMVEKTIYLLTYIAKASDVDMDEYQHFLNSFQLLSKMAKASLQYVVDNNTISVN